MSGPRSTPPENRRDSNAASARQRGIFMATDPVPPLNGYEFDAEDIDELGLELCIRVAERVRVDPEFSAGAVGWFTRRIRGKA